MRAGDFDIYGWIAPRCMTIEEAKKKGEMNALISLSAAQEVFATLDRQIAYLKARVAELERPDVFWSPDDDYDEIAKATPYEVYDIGYVDPLIPLEVLGSSSLLTSIWLVLEHVPADNNEDVDYEGRWRRFPTKEEAESFCQKMRAEKGEGA